MRIIIEDGTDWIEVHSDGIVSERGTPPETIDRMVDDTIKKLVHAAAIVGIKLPTATKAFSDHQEHLEILKQLPYVREDLHKKFP